jgi:hypothetical protein
VLRVLVGDNPEREERCWKQTPLDTLHERGTQTGLDEYLHEVRQHLVPLLRKR